MFSIFHSRCKDVEAALRSHVEDLKAENARLIDQNCDLLDRVMAMTNPMAAAALRSTAPTPARPTIHRPNVRPAVPSRFPDQTPQNRNPISRDSSRTPALRPPTEPVDYRKLSGARAVRVAPTPPPSPLHSAAPAQAIADPDIDLDIELDEQEEGGGE